jgi:hypothetical protein
MCVNLIPGHTYYEYSVWVLKPGMTRVEGEEPLSIDLNGLLVQCSGTFWRVCDAYRYALPGGASHDMTFPKPGNHDHHLAPKRRPGPVWYGSVPSLVPFNQVAPPL